MAAETPPTVRQDKFLLMPGATPRQRKRFNAANAQRGSSSFNTATSLCLFVVMMGAFSANSDNLERHRELSWLIAAALLTAAITVATVLILRTTANQRLVRSGIAAQVPKAVWQEYVTQCGTANMKPWEEFNSLDFPELERAIEAHRKIGPSTFSSVSAHLHDFIKVAVAGIVQQQKERLNEAASQLPGRVIDPVAPGKDLDVEELAQLQKVMDRFPVPGAEVDDSPPSVSSEGIDMRKSDS